MNSRMNVLCKLQQIKSTTRIRSFKSPLQKRFTSSEVSSYLKGLPDNAFNRERQAIKDHAAATSVIPAVAIASVNAWVLWEQHWEHFEHLPPLEERVEYPYQNIRTKNFFWGDGDKDLIDLKKFVDSYTDDNLLKAGMIRSIITKRIKLITRNYDIALLNTMYYMEPRYYILYRGKPIQAE
ncbi:Cytochrome c oxidase subunit 13, mitochondrial [Erysiphe necator]|nr:Cytochrome c oxidase subunit 13, mitochondrial [Erysiphe necator]